MPKPKKQGQKSPALTHKDLNPKVIGLSNSPGARKIRSLVDRGFRIQGKSTAYRNALRTTSNKVR